MREQVLMGKTREAGGRGPEGPGQAEIEREWSEYIQRSGQLWMATTENKRAFGAGFAAADKLYAARIRDFVGQVADPDEEDPPNSTAEPPSPVPSHLVPDPAQEIVDCDTLLAIGPGDLVSMIGRALRHRECDWSAIHRVYLRAHPFRPDRWVVGVILVDDERATRFVGPDRHQRSIEGVVFSCPPTVRTEDRPQFDATELLSACRALLDLVEADHPDHFAARMSDSEMVAIKWIKSVVARAEELDG